MHGEFEKVNMHFYNPGGHYSGSLKVSFWEIGDWAACQRKGGWDVIVSDSKGTIIPV